MCGQHNVRASAKNNTRQNTDEGETPVPREKFKFLIPPGIEPGPPRWKPGTLQLQYNNNNNNNNNNNYYYYYYYDY